MILGEFDELNRIFDLRLIGPTQTFRRVEEVN
jgi:hypothetical protein